MTCNKFICCLNYNNIKEHVYRLDNQHSRINEINEFLTGAKLKPELYHAKLSKWQNSVNPHVPFSNLSTLMAKI